MSNIKPIMFDVDGTLVHSLDFDEQCYLEAVHDVLGVYLDNQWNRYAHVTDTGLLMAYLVSQNTPDRLPDTERRVKQLFIEKISAHLEKEPVQPIAGIIDFFSALKQTSNIRLAIATGGWRETALLKLNSAGIDVSDIPIASSNDHYSRTEIMKIARSRMNLTSHLRPVHFGDAEWDKVACEKLEYNFVLVGNRAEHKNKIDDYCDQDLIMKYLTK